MATSKLTDRLHLARKHASAHSMQLAMSRWTSGNSWIQMEIASALMPASQVNRHAQAQKDFLAWLQNGGFACEAGVVNAAGVAPENALPNTEATALPAAAPSVPSGGQPARNCNSLVIRIHDAVE